MTKEESYDKGYADGMRAYGYHMELCKEEQEPCEDCVSRVNAIATIKNLYPDMPVMDIMGARRKWQEKYSQYIECEKEIERLPSIQPKTDILEQIRAEISDLSVYYDNDYFSGNKDGMFKCNEVLEIIDKAIKEVNK